MCCVFAVFFRYSKLVALFLQLTAQSQQMKWNEVSPFYSMYSQFCLDFSDSELYSHSRHIGGWLLFVYKWGLLMYPILVCRPKHNRRERHSTRSDF